MRAMQPCELSHPYLLFLFHLPMMTGDLTNYKPGGHSPSPVLCVTTMADGEEESHGVMKYYRMLLGELKKVEEAPDTASAVCRVRNLGQWLRDIIDSMFAQKDALKIQGATLRLLMKARDKAVARDHLETQLEMDDLIAIFLPVQTVRQYNYWRRYFNDCGSIPLMGRANLDFWLHMVMLHGRELPRASLMAESNPIAGCDTRALTDYLHRACLAGDKQSVILYLLAVSGEVKLEGLGPAAVS